MNSNQPENFLERVRIASPCPMSWDEMQGDERKRFCQHCNLHVYNLSAMTKREAEELIVKTEGRLCARLYRRADGTVLTKDCPVGLKALRRRLKMRVGVFLSALFGFGLTAFGQEQKTEGECQKEEIKIIRTVDTAKTKNQFATIMGTIYDPNQAVIIFARITLTDEKTKAISIVKPDDRGVFFYPQLKAGTYTLQIEAKGFKTFIEKKIKVEEHENVVISVTLAIAIMGEVIQVESVNDETTPPQKPK